MTINKYTLSHGEYEELVDIDIYHAQKFSPLEFDMLVKKAVESLSSKHRIDIFDVVGKLCESYGFYKVESHASTFLGDGDYKISESTISTQKGC